jgi:hypothetical protein
VHGFAFVLPIAFEAVVVLKQSCAFCQVHTANRVAARHTRWRLCASCGEAKATVSGAVGRARFLGKHDAIRL